MTMTFRKYWLSQLFCRLNKDGQFGHLTHTILTAVGDENGCSTLRTTTRPAFVAYMCAKARVCRRGVEPKNVLQDKIKGETFLSV